MKLTRNKYIPCLDVTRGAEGSPTWVPIDLSTQFELGFNPNDEDYDYICYQNTLTETTSYALELPQEITLDSTNPMYRFIMDFAADLPTGGATKVPALIIFPDPDTGEATRGAEWKDAAISLDTLNTTDGNISFSLKLNGSMTKGTVSMTSGNVITFTESDWKKAEYDPAQSVITGMPVAGEGA